MWKTPENNSSLSPRASRPFPAHLVENLQIQFAFSADSAEKKGGAADMWVPNCVRFVCDYPMEIRPQMIGSVRHGGRTKKKTPVQMEHGESTQLWQKTPPKIDKRICSGSKLQALQDAKYLTAQMIICRYLILLFNTHNRVGNCRW